MGRKSNAKGSTPIPPPPAKAGRSPLVFAGVAAIVVVVGSVVYFRSTTDNAAAPAAVQQRPPVAQDLKPHPQANLPPIEFPAYPTQRSPEVVTAAYKFAAEHPEVLSYVPCFCGCERSGHRGNEDCFVKSRDINGDVVEWEPHGMECAVCLDVATRARQLFTAGTSVPDIRATIEKEWGTRATTHTPTPEPPHSH